MGVSYSALTVIGVKFNPKSKNLYTEEKVKTFPHEYPESVNFCPTTGKKLWTTKKVFVPELDVNKEKFGEFKIVLSSCGDSDDYFLSKEGFYQKSEGISVMNIKDTTELKEGLKAMLEPFKLWIEEDFGIYTVLGVS